MPPLTLDISAELESKVKKFETWLPAILEVSLLNFKSPAYQAAGAVTEFLMTNPSAQDAAAYKLPERFQERVDVLLEHNRSATLTEEETRELDDYLKLEHVARIMKRSTKESGLTEQR
jgi:hypothetical protein